ncbi:MAG TPA: T9SS type A sorting domain-containing protein, partial [Saprospiraceae bacterium]|nr:T9SS type A sorting domain-containing protein [Saprospiraceae bacterium]
QTMYYFEISAPETGKPIVVFLPVVSNPANDEVLLSWELKRKARITLSVSDAMGRLTVTNPLGELQAGIWTNSVPTAALSNGVYYAVLYAGKQRIVQQFIVQH